MDDTTLLSLVLNDTGKAGYEATRELCSRISFLAATLSSIIGMLAHSNSLIRNRGLLLLSSESEADRECAWLPHYLALLHDEKPITVRTCLKGLPQIVKNNPEKKALITTAVRKMDTSIYPSSMRALIEKDRNLVITPGT